MKTLAHLVLALAATTLPAAAFITSVVETGRGVDPAAIIAAAFGEDAVAYADRTHQHNGPAFDSNTGLLSATGTTVTDLPPYLLGNNYVRFSNDARDNVGYSARITTDTPSTFYVLIDNRINGPATALTSPANTDPVIGGSLQWVSDGGWQRVNTGISPNGQPDYTAIDEGGNGSGAGASVENFMSVWKFPTVATAVTVSNGRVGGNNIAVIAVPTAPPPDPIVNFTGSPISIPPGGTALLSWLIAPTATSATINPGIGNILPLTDLNGAGSFMVNPAVNTTYTLSVNTPGGNASRPVSIAVQPLATYTANRQRIDAGEIVVLNWRVRPDALVSIDGIGSVNAQTDPLTGLGSLTVSPVITTDYVIRAEAEGLTNVATASVVIRPAGQAFALIDLGATGGRAEPGAVNSLTLGAGADGANGLPFGPALLTADQGQTFTLTVDNLDPDGNPVGSIDWRDRGDGPGLPFNRLLEDFVKNNAGLIRVSLGQLPSGTYDVTSYHVDAANSQTDQIRILVTDANGTAIDTTVLGNASWPGHPANTGAPTINGLAPGLARPRQADFRITANGTDNVVIYFDSRTTPVDTELPLNGLRLSKIPPRPADPTWALIDVGANSGQPEPGSANLTVIGNGPQTSGNLGPVTLTSRTGVDFQLTLDNMDPLGNFTGSLDWRDRGNAPDVPLAWLAQDLVKNGAGLIRATLTGLPAGVWIIRSYHLDPGFSQAAIIKVFVTDATRTAEDTLVVADSSFPTGDPGAPQLNGLNAGLITTRSAIVQVTSNGTDAVILYFDSTQAGADLELPLTGLRLTPAASAPEVIPVTNLQRTITGSTASFSLTFASKPDKTYRVYASPDLTNWGLPLTTNLPATGTSTLFTESGIPLATPRRFYQVREN